MKSQALSIVADKQKGPHDWLTFSQIFANIAQKFLLHVQHGGLFENFVVSSHASLRPGL
jgi:hypothetical protein